MQIHKKAWPNCVTKLARRYGAGLLARIKKHLSKETSRGTKVDTNPGLGHALSFGDAKLLINFKKEVVDTNYSCLLSDLHCEVSCSKTLKDE